MSRLIEPGSAADAASECADECSNLIVSTRSITSMESSFEMSDDQGLGRKYVLRVLPPYDENESRLSDTPLALEHPPKPRSDSLSLSGQPANDESVAISCVDADNRSTVYSDSLADNGLQDKDTAETSESSASILDALASRFERHALVDGIIGSFHEYIRPNAPTGFLFSFTPSTGTEPHNKQPCKNALIGHLEKAPTEKDQLPPTPGQTIKLRRRRGVDVRSLTFEDWRPGTDSESKDQSVQHSQDGQSQAMRRTTAAEPVPLNPDAQSDTKATEDRRRFDFLVSRLQQKLSERSRGSYCGSTKEGSTSGASRQSSRTGSVPSNNGLFSENAASSASSHACMGSKSLACNDPLRAIREGQVVNDIQGDSQPKSDRGQCTPPPYSVPTAATNLQPQVFYPMMHQMQQFPPPWITQNQGPYPGQTESAANFAKGYHPPALPPQMVAWPPVPGVFPHVPIQFGGYQYTHRPQTVAPGLPLPPAAAIKHPPKPPRSSAKNIPFIPLNATEQQKIEEHIEYLKAAVPSFALVSRRRQRQRWLREQSNLENRKDQQRHNLTRDSKNDLQSYQPLPQQPALQPIAPWNPQPYHQLQQQYYPPMFSSTAAPDVPRGSYQPAFNPMPLPSNLWSGQV